MNVDKAGFPEYLAKLEEVSCVKVNTFADLKKVLFARIDYFNEPGMIKQLTDPANLGVLGDFIDMLTDSRSSLSYTRHEYFRRILCNLIGNWVEKGELQPNMDTLGAIVEDICYNNTNPYDISRL